MTKFAIVLVLAARAFAQTSSIQGDVRELPDLAPIASVAVTLTSYEGSGDDRRQVVLATTVTSNTGAYEFRSLKPGNYTVEVAKPGYYWGETGGRSLTPTGGLNTRIEDEGGSVTVNLTMVRPGSLSGHVEDDDGNPIQGLTVHLARASAPEFSAERTDTDAQGRFTFPQLIPDRYMVRIEPREVRMMALQKFTEDDVSKVDEDFQTTYWPGGSTVATPALAAVVPSGGDLDIGALRPKAASLYRTRLKLSDTCTGDVNMSIAPLPLAPNRNVPNYRFPCAAEYLLIGLAAGRFNLRVVTESGWAIADFDTGPDARPIDLRLQSTVTLTGRIIASEGVQVPDSLRGRISLLPETAGIPAAIGDLEENRFRIERVLGVPLQVRASFLSPPYYASEIRYGGRPAPGGIITPTADTEIEIVVDDKPGSITGTYTGGDGSEVRMLIYQMRNGQPLEGIPSPRAADGRFTAPYVPPGTYQILALQESSVRRSVAQGQSQPNFANGQTVIVRRGETSNISVRVQ